MIFILFSKYGFACSQGLLFLRNRPIHQAYFTIDIVLLHVLQPGFFHLTQPVICWFYFWKYYFIGFWVPEDWRCPHCLLLQGDDPFFSDNFGCEMAQQYHRCFKLSIIDSRPYFVRENGKTIQTMPSSSVMTHSDSNCWITSTTVDIWWLLFLLSGCLKASRSEMLSGLYRKRFW